MPTTEHRGYSIRYSENEDKWVCYDVGASHEKLSRVKAKIDEMHRKMRKESAFNCLDVSSHSGVTAVDATVVEYLGPVRAKTSSFQRVGDGEIIDHEVAYMSARGGISSKKTRQRGRLSSLALNTDENALIIEKAKLLYDKAKRIEAQLRDTLEKLEKASFDDIADLVAASEHRFTE